MDLTQKELVFFKDSKLFERKLALLTSLQQKDPLTQASFVRQLDFHNTQLKIFSGASELNSLLWQMSETPAFNQQFSQLSFDLHFYDARQFSLYPRDWVEEVSDCWTRRLDADSCVAIHRDFIAVLNQSTVKILLGPEAQDGLHNFLRWLLPTYLLGQQAALIHSSAVVLANGKALLFLGKSGAGKTTIASLGRPRPIISDDMNILFIANHHLYVRSACMGGKFLDAAVQAQDFPVQAIFNLHQGGKLELKSMSPSRASLLILSSMANLFWNDGEYISKAAFDLSIDFARKTNCLNLTFPLSQETWNALESQNNSKKRPISLAEAQ